MSHQGEGGNCKGLSAGATAMLVLAAWAVLAVQEAAGQVRQGSLGDLSAGPFVRMVRHDDGSRSVTARDETTREMAITTYDPEGELQLRRVYQLDRYGKPTTFFVYDGSGRPLMRGEYVYDVQDRVVEEKLFELPSQRPIRTVAQNYDKAGNRLSPQYMHQGSLPPQVLRWLDPDANLETETEKQAKTGEFLPSLFGRKKEEREAEGAGGGEPERKRPFGGLFQRRKN